MEVSYKVRLEKAARGRLVAGRFDGNHPAVACAARGQVLLYDRTTNCRSRPHGAPPLRTLNFNKTITALDAGP